MVNGRSAGNRQCGSCGETGRSARTCTVDLYISKESLSEDSESLMFWWCCDSLKWCNFGKMADTLYIYVT